jgi:hypothetical protein
MGMFLVTLFRHTDLQKMFLKGPDTNYLLMGRTSQKSIRLESYR